MAACISRGIQDFAFYDDALLLNAERHLSPILEEVRVRGWRLRLHTPNGLHASEITAELATLIRQVGFRTVRLSLETIEPSRQQSTGAKISTGAFAQAVSYLKSVGFRAGELGAYILAGLPGQPLAETEATVRFVHGLGVQAKLALFSPIPHTRDGDRALPAGADPLLHNNTAYPYSLGADHVWELQRIKQLAKEGNAALLSGP
jgi:MoaA/NifB/PqqE/SkfB family radical SAM enzyme